MLLCYVIFSKVVLCSPSLLFHAPFLSPFQAHNVASTIFWRDNQKIVGLGREILYNIQPLNPTQHWSCWRPWGCPNSSLGVPGGQPDLTFLGIWSLKGCHTSTFSRIHQSQRSQEVVTPRSAQGPNSCVVVTPRPAQEFNLQEAVTFQLAWGSAPWPMDAWLSGCNSSG